MQTEARLLTMLAGWIGFYGFRRRSWVGSGIAMLGVSLAQGTMMIGEREEQ